MSDVLIASLQKRVDDLTGELATIRAEAKSRRIKGKALGEENDTLKTQLATLTTERDTLAAAAKAQPHELQVQLDEYKGKLRDRDHRDKFTTLAKAAGVTQDKALDDLWQLSGYKAEADEIDDTKITAAITSTLKDRDWLKAAPASGDATTPPPSGANATLQSGPGAHRGGAAGSTDLDKALEARYPNAFRLA
jgi:chromosome segregation ATPase